MHPSSPPEARPTTDSPDIALLFDRIEQAVDAHTAGNRAQARLWAALAELIRLARANPQIYLRPVGLAHSDAPELAADAAAFDAGLRLQLSSSQVRTIAFRAQTLEDRMPRLHAAFQLGATSAAHVGAALELITGWSEDGAVRAFDEQLAEPAGSLTLSAFRAKARRLKDRLSAEPAELRHARSFADRRVWFEPDEDGMAWIHAFVTAPDAVRIVSRLNATARAEQKKTAVGDPEWRSRDQIRADLAVSWLAGDGTPTAAKVRPILLVPLLSLIADGDEPIELRGYGTVDKATAARLIAAAPSFRRVATDPFTGERLRYDRTRYRPSTAQRDWIAFRYESCIDPTCSRPVDDTDVDHLEEWVRDRGRTNDDNLLPLCEQANRRKNLSRIEYKRLPNGHVTITTPSGHSVDTEPAPF